MNDYTDQIELLNALQKKLMIKYKRLLLRKKRREKIEEINSSEKKNL